MTDLFQKVKGDPLLVRVVPFVVFLALTSCQGLLGEASRYWFYLIKTVAGVWLIYAVYPVVTEMRWRVSWEAVVGGIAVFVLWVGLDGVYPSLEEIYRSYLCPLLQRIGLVETCRPEKEIPAAWNPHQQFGSGSGLAWLFIVVRIAGSALVVPPLEEVFYRSFIYRYLISPKFQEVSLGAFRSSAFLITSLIFGLAHREWLAGILCGFVYQGLVLKKNRLGDAMTAHAITNFLLGLWVVWKGAWEFW